MAKKNLTEIVCIIDKSGSMDVVRGDTIGGFNSFLKEQKKAPGEANFTLVLFDHEYHLMQDGKSIEQVEELDEKTYIPGGTTALLDAIGKTTDSVGKRLAKIEDKDRPEKVIVAILTDGLENASSDYSRKKIFDMIGHQKDRYKWEFMFLAAGQDAIQAGASINISVANCANYLNTSKGIRKTYGAIGQSVSCFRATGTIGKLDDDIGE